MAEIELSGVSKAFGETQALTDVSLSVPDGAFVVLLGPTGAGKTTTLRLIAGLERPDRGEIRIGGRSVLGDTPAQRNVAMVFQQYSLYPHMTVRENLAFPLRSPILRTPEAQIARKIGEVAEVLRIAHKLDNKATALSGGEMQRVSIGRALVRDPAAHLMDEPLSSLDAKLRAELRIELKRIQASLGATLLYVTHDQVEAMTMADKIVVLQAGRIEQVGSPLDLYRTPRNIFVAGFIGSPKMNFLGGEDAAKRNAQTIGIRPEHISVSSSEGEWKGTVGVSEHLGSDTFFHVHLDGKPEPMTVRAGGEVDLHHGNNIWLTPDPQQIHRFDSEGLRIG